MSLVALDTNVLVYAILEPDSTKGRTASTLVERVTGRGVVAAQVLGEVISVIRRKRLALLPRVLGGLTLLRSSLVVAPTTAEVVEAAGDLALRHQLQIWDCVIWKASLLAGATHLLSEDMQDRLSLEGLTLVNPFVPANDALLARLLPA